MQGTRTTRHSTQLNGARGLCLVCLGKGSRSLNIESTNSSIIINHATNPLCNQSIDQPINQATSRKSTSQSSITINQSSISQSINQLLNQSIKTINQPINQSNHSNQTNQPIKASDQPTNKPTGQSGKHFLTSCIPGNIQITSHTALMKYQIPGIRSLDMLRC